MPDFGLNPTTHPVPISTAPSASDLGRKRSVPNSDGTFQQQVCLYVPSTLQGNLAIGQPYYLAHGSTIGQYFQPAAPAGNATSGITRLAVVLVGGTTDITSVPTTGTYGWFAYAGKCKALVDGTTDVAAGDTLKINSKVIAGAFIKDSVAEASQTVKTGVAEALAAQTTDSAVLTDVLLFGEPGIIA